MKGYDRVMMHACCRRDTEIARPAEIQIRDLSRITLGGSQIRMPENHLAHNLSRRSRSGGIGSRISPRIMGLQADPYKFPRLLYHHSRHRIRN
jgi:hypothetical protein